MNSFLLKGLALACSLIGSIAAATETNNETPCEVRALLQREGVSPQQATSVTGPVRTNEQLRQIFLNTRSDLINEISGGIPFNELHPHQKLMVRRLQSMDELVINECRTGAVTPPASNEQLTNRIKVCSNLKSAPEIALRGMFGHELGHSLDLVNLGCRTFRIRQSGARLESSYQQVVEAPIVKGVSRPETGGLDVNAFRARLIEISDAGRSFNECAFRGVGERPEIENMITRGQIEMVDSGVPVMWNPQRSAFQCLANNYGWPRPPATQDEAQEGGYFEYGEASAQIWGARAVGLYVRQNPNLTPREALELLKFTQLNDISIKGKSEKEREIDQAYFSEPSLQSVLRCTPDAKQNCLSHFRPSVPPPRNSTGNPAASSR